MPALKRPGTPDDEEAGPHAGDAGRSRSRKATMRALIIHEGRSRAGLAGARALGRAGWEVGTGAPSRGPVEASRWGAGWHPVPLPEDGLDAFLEAVAAAVRAGRYEVVFGTGDAEVLALSFGRDSLGEVVVPHASHATVLRALDKLHLCDAALQAGLAVPATTAATEGALRAV